MESPSVKPCLNTKVLEDDSKGNERAESVQEVIGLVTDELYLETDWILGINTI